MRVRSTFPILIAAATIASCKDCDDGPKAKDASAHSTSNALDASVDVAAPPPKEAGAPHEAGASLTVPFDEDAGASACKLTYGPSELLFRGPAAMIVDNAKNELRLVANDSGKPRIFTVALDAKVTPPPPPAFVSMRWPPCEVAGKFVYCQAGGGAITRTTIGANDTKTVVSKSRNARIAAAPLGPNGEHSVVAFLDTKQTSEGAMIQAFVLFDEDNAPTRLSDDGAGATTMRLVPRGESAVAAYLDTRTAMVPVHARSLSLENGKDLALGDDVVAFVGGSPERGIDLAIGGIGNGAKTFILLPMPRETVDFGMAAIPVMDPPRDDVSVTWSLYPNGLDPAPIGASLDGWVARVRPREKMPGARRVLELGRIDEKGAFMSLGLISDKPITDVTIASDAKKGVWILYGDSTATYLERRVCP